MLYCAIVIICGMTHHIHLWRPIASVLCFFRFSFPDSLRWASTNFALIQELLPCLQGIDRRVQALNAPDIENAYASVPARLRPWNMEPFSTYNVFEELTYSETDPVRNELPPICE